MAGTDDVTDPIEALLESGKLDENASLADIEAALEQVDSDSSPNKTPDDQVGDTSGDKGEGAAKTDGADDKTQAGDKPDATDVTGEPAAPGQQQEPVEIVAPIAGKNGGTIPYGVLDGTRKSLASEKAAREQAERVAVEERQRREQAEQELETLRRQQSESAKQTKDVQAAASAAGVKGNVADIDVEKLRGDFPSEIVDAIAALQTRNAQVEKLLLSLQQNDAQRVRTEEEVLQQQLQDDIDSVPALAEWQANDKLKWAAACALDDAMLKDADWRGKSRVERYTEIAKQLGGSAPQQTDQVTSTPAAVAAGTKAKVDAALAQATASAVPLSHSGLPAGSAPAQSEVQSLERLDVTQVSDMFANMTDEQIEAMLAKV